MSRRCIKIRHISVPTLYVCNLNLFNISVYIVLMIGPYLVINYYFSIYMIHFLLTPIRPYISKLSFSILLQRRGVYIVQPDYIRSLNRNGYTLLSCISYCIYILQVIPGRLYSSCRHNQTRSLYTSAAQTIYIYTYQLPNQTIIQL